MPPRRQSTTAQQGISRYSSVRPATATGYANNLIPPTPAAPTPRHADEFADVTPPSASTGTAPAIRQAVRRAPSPMPATTTSPSTRFSNTGPNKISPTPSATTRATSSSVWHDALTIGSHLPAAAKTLRTCSVVNSPWREVKCTPSAPAITATSARPFTSSFVLPPCSANTLTIRSASRTISLAAICFSRSCTYSTPSSAQDRALEIIAACDSPTSLPVMAYRNIPPV